MKRKRYTLSGSRILVTGGAGAIGSALVARLSEYPVKQITVLDDLSRGDAKRLRGIGSKVRLVRYCLGGTGRGVLDRELKGVDYVFHLAALKHSGSIHSQEQTLLRNILGTYQLCEAAVKNRVKKIVFSSSLHVYGCSGKSAFKENASPNPETVYGLSKLCCEHLLRFFHKEFGLNYLTLRYFFVYGPTRASVGDKDTLIAKNFQRILMNARPEVRGDGRQVVDYVFRDDIVEATVRAMTSSACAEIINVASGAPVTVAKLIDEMIAVSGKKIKKRFVSADETTGTCLTGDNSKLKRLLHFKPRVTLKEGLARTYRWMRDKHSHAL